MATQHTSMVSQNLLALAGVPKDDSTAKKFRKSIKKKGADPNACCFRGYVPLQLVAMSDNDVGAIALVEGGADVSAQHPVDARSALHTAVITTSTNVATFLISIMTNLDVRDDVGGAPLHHAAVLDNADLTRQLVESGADPNAVDRAGDQPLHWAASSNAVEAAAVLIALGADVNGADAAGETALHFAAKRGFVEMVELLLQNGADATAKDNAGNTPGDEICEVAENCTEEVTGAMERMLIR